MSAVHSGAEPARFKSLFGGFWKPAVSMKDPYAASAQRLYEEGVVGRALPAQRARFAAEGKQILAAPKAARPPPFKLGRVLPSAPTAKAAAS
jgi:hypothetical protein